MLPCRCELAAVASAPLLLARGRTGRSCAPSTLSRPPEKMARDQPSHDRRTRRVTGLGALGAEPLHFRLESGFFVRRDTNAHNAIGGSGAARAAKHARTLQHCFTCCNDVSRPLAAALRGAPRGTSDGGPRVPRSCRTRLPLLRSTAVAEGRADRHGRTPRTVPRGRRLERLAPRSGRMFGAETSARILAFRRGEDRGQSRAGCSVEAGAKGPVSRELVSNETGQAAKFNAPLDASTEGPPLRCRARRPPRGCTCRPWRGSGALSAP